jgi:hypothetical protein
MLRYRLVADAGGDCGIGVGGRRSAARGCWSDAPLGAGSSGGTRGRSRGGVKTTLRVRDRPRGDTRTASGDALSDNYTVRVWDGTHLPENEELKGMDGMIDRTEALCPVSGRQLSASTLDSTSVEALASS